MIASVGVGEFRFPASSAASAPSWAPLRVGAGGWVHDGVILSDGTQVIQTDTYGAWKYNAASPRPGPAFGSGMWQQLISPASLNASPFNDLFTIQQSTGGGQGVYGIDVAQSNTQIIYASYMGRIIKTIDGGSHWSNTGYTFVDFNDMPANDASGAGAFSFGKRLQIDPINPIIVFVYSYNGLWRTLDGGVSWTKLTAITTPTSFGGTITFDPRVSQQSGGVSQTLYAASNGNGVWKTTDGGANWAKLSSAGMPTNVRRSFVDQNGTYWHVDGTSLYKYVGSTWSTVALTGGNPSNGSLHSVAVNPNNASEIIVTNQTGEIIRSLDGGANWLGGNASAGGYPHGPLSPTGLIASDIPYLANVQLDTVGNCFYDASGTLWMFQGVGIWNTTGLPTNINTGNWYWNSQSAGEEQLVTNCLVSVPGGPLFAGFFDRAVFTITDQKSYQNSYEPNGFAAAPGGFSIDYDGINTTFVAAGVAGAGLVYSTVGGGAPANWNVRSNLPYQGGDGHGTIAVAANSAKNVLFLHFGTGNLHYCLDVTAATPTWVNTSTYFTSTFGFAPTGNDSYLVADKVTANCFYLIHGTNTYRSIDGGQTWSAMGGNPQTVAAGGTGSGAVFRAVGGQAGNLLFTTGQNYNNNHPQPYSIAFSQNSGASWSNLNANISEPWHIGVGKQVGSYPSIGFAGWYNNVRGIWVSDDMGAKWRSIGDWTTYGSWDLNITWLEGDMNYAGAWHLAYPGSGAARFGN